MISTGHFGSSKTQAFVNILQVGLLLCLQFVQKGIEFIFGEN